MRSGCDLYLLLTLISISNKTVFVSRYEALHLEEIYLNDEINSLVKVFENQRC